MTRIYYPSEPHEYRGWTYAPMIDQDGDGFDRAYHMATREDLPEEHLGSIPINGHWRDTLSRAEFEAEIDRIEREGLPPPPPKLRSSGPRKPSFAAAVEDLRNG